MKILLTNDDGYKSKALLRLAETLVQYSHEPIVFSPISNVSGKSNGITIDPIVKIERKRKDGIDVFAVHGTTADCVLLGYSYAPDIDLVISGMNYGANIGKDTLNSATVGGAKEAISIGIPAIAVSINSYYPRNLDAIINYFCMLLTTHFSKVIAKEYLMNINFPDKPVDQIKGVKVTHMSKRGWMKKVVFEQTKNGLIAHIKAEKPRSDKEKYTDLYWLSRGYITVTPVVPDLIDYNLIHKLKTYLEVE